MFRLGVFGAGILVVVALSVADLRDFPLRVVGPVQGWKSQLWAESEHTAPHDQVGAVEEEAMATMRCVPGCIPPGGWTPHGLPNKQLCLTYITPLSEFRDVKAAAKYGPKPPGGGAPPFLGYAATVHVKKTLEEAVRAANCTLALRIKGIIPFLHLDYKDKAGHKLGETEVAVTLAVASGAPCTFEAEEGGVIALTVDGNGNTQPLYDGDGELVWETPKSIVMRLTTTVADAGGGQVTYTYQIENLDEVEREFFIAEITSAAFPSGWSGTLQPNTAQAITVTSSDPIFRHNVKVDYKFVPPDGDPDNEFENIWTFHAYVPESRVAHGGQNVIVASAHDPVQVANVITFRVTEVAEKAILYREVPIDGVYEVAVLDGPLLPGIDYQLSDPEFQPGTNSYRIRTGEGVNGWEGVPVSIVNGP